MRYQFSARARNAHGWSEWCSLPPIVRTRGAFPPTTPTVVKDNKGRRGIVATDSSWIMIEWRPPADKSLGTVEKYELQMCNRNGNVDDVWETCLVKECTGDENGDPQLDDCYGFITNLHAATNYIFRVKCRTARGWSCWSGISEEILTLGRF